jgi:hypothetical protein
VHRGSDSLLEGSVVGVRGEVEEGSWRSGDPEAVQEEGLVRLEAGVVNLHPSTATRAARERDDVDAAALRAARKEPERMGGAQVA